MTKNSNRIIGFLFLFAVCNSALIQSNNFGQQRSTVSFTQQEELPEK